MAQWLTDMSRYRAVLEIITYSTMQCNDILHGNYLEFGRLISHLLDFALEISGCFARALIIRCTIKRQALAVQISRQPESLKLGTL